MARPNDWEKTLRIVVCVKQIHHIYSRTGRDPATNFIAYHDQVMRINPADELALEMAVKIKHLSRVSHIKVLTLGHLKGKRELRLCIAAGADEIYQVLVKEPTDPAMKSSYLAAAIKQLGADLILCGEQSLDTRHGQVPALLAHRLGFPFVSCATEVSVSSNHYYIRVRTKRGKGMRQILRCPLPVVISMTGQGTILATTPYPAKRDAATFPVQKIFMIDGLKSAVSKRIRVLAPRPKAKIYPSPSPWLDAYHRIEQLLAGSKVDKKGEILDGSPEHTAEQFITFLGKHGFLERVEKDADSHVL